MGYFPRHGWFLGGGKHANILGWRLELGIQEAVSSTAVYAIS